MARCGRLLGLLWLFFFWWVMGGWPPMAPPKEANQTTNQTHEIKHCGIHEINLSLLSLNWWVMGWWASQWLRQEKRTRRREIGWDELSKKTNLNSAVKWNGMKWIYWWSQLCWWINKWMPMEWNEQAAHQAAPPRGKPREPINQIHQFPRKWKRGIDWSWVGFRGENGGRSIKKIFNFL